MHGSFSPIDVHNTLVLAGPQFRTGLAVATPSGNVDVAPTVAALFGLSMPAADGRVLDEALRRPVGTTSITSMPQVVHPAVEATGLTFASPIDPTGRTVDTTLSAGRYTIDLRVKDVTVDGRTYRYFDSAEAVRR